MAFHATRPEIGIGLADGGVRSWDLGSGEAPVLVSQHDAEVVDIPYTPDGEGLVSQSRDRTLAITDVDSGARRLLRGHDGVAYWGLDAEADEVVTVGWEGTVRHWAASAGEHRSRRVPRRRMTALVSSERTIIGTEGGELLEWSEDSGEPKVLERLGSKVVAVSTAAGTIAAATRDGRVAALADGKLHILHEGDGEPVALALDDGGRRVYAGVAGGGVRIWSLGGGEPVRHETGEITIRALLPQADGSIRIAGWTPDGRTWLGQIAASGELQAEPVDRDGILAVAFDPTTQRVAWSKHTREVMTWDGESVRTLGQHPALVDAMAFDPTGRTLVTAGRDGIVRLWDPRSGHHRTVDASRRPLRAVTFDDDGDTVLVTGDDQRIHFVPDGLPYGREALADWIRGATSLEVEPAPIARRRSFE